MEEIGDKRTVPVFSVIASVAIIATLVAATVFTDGAASCTLIGVASEGALTGAVNLGISGAMDFKANPSKYCFVAGTLVLSTVGLVAIEELQPGDLVYAKEAVGEERCVDVNQIPEIEPVLEVFVHEVDETYVVTIGDEQIETTADHPFYDRDGEVVEVKDLQPGQELSTFDGKNQTVDAVECVHHDKTVKVYNFCVAEDHTYFVGECGVLVHNSTCISNQGADLVDDSHIIGRDGTQVTSKTTWKNGTTERIDVENPAPGIRNGNIHYHDSNNKKYLYDIANNQFIEDKTKNIASKSIQELLEDKSFIKGLDKARKILGE